MEAVVVWVSAAMVEEVVVWVSAYSTANARRKMLKD
jgi:hypothetical protein